ncbi:MAG: SRPBCC domain-containing protein [Bacteroidetes bacterium]|nr:SRPBCC domain-containing protein [Bacteroidota bacterium]
MKTKNIQQTVSFKASPKEVYEMIMDTKKHGAITGGKIKMSRKPGGKFDIFDGYCHGYNIELEEGKKIVQAWHFAEDGWPDDHFSACTFVFEKSPSGTKLTFTQTDIPEHKAAALADGWKQYYWEPMKAYLKK